MVEEFIDFRFVAKNQFVNGRVDLRPLSRIPPQSVFEDEQIMEKAKKLGRSLDKVGAVKEEIEEMQQQMLERF